MKSIFITGGGGYIGHVLVPRLLKDYIVTVYDTFYFENNLPQHKNLNIIKGDIRDAEKLDNSITNQDIFIQKYANNSKNFVAMCTCTRYSP